MDSHMKVKIYTCVYLSWQGCAWGGVILANTKYITSGPFLEQIGNMIIKIIHDIIVNLANTSY